MAGIAVAGAAVLGAALDGATAMASVLASVAAEGVTAVSTAAAGSAGAATASAETKVEAKVRGAQKKENRDMLHSFRTPSRSASLVPSRVTARIAEIAALHRFANSADGRLSPDCADTRPGIAGAPHSGYLRRRPRIMETEWHGNPMETANRVNAERDVD